MNVASSHLQLEGQASFVQPLAFCRQSVHAGLVHCVCDVVVLVDQLHDCGKNTSWLLSVHREIFTPL